MKCDTKTMLKVGGVLAVLLAAGFLAFPQIRPAVLATLPFALLALCPLSMFFTMRGSKKDDAPHDMSV